MAIDLTKLTQSELLQIVNSTPQGETLTRSRLRRQMDAGALRFGDGASVHLVRYVRWLVDEMDRPRPAWAADARPLGPEHTGLPDSRRFFGRGPATGASG